MSVTGDLAIQAYCREAEQTMELPTRRRRTLLAGLRQELEERFASKADLSLQDICDVVGSPEDSAAALMESVPWEEHACYRAQKRRKLRVLVAVLAAVMTLALCYALYMRATGGTVIIETTHYVEGIPEDFPTSGEGTVTYHYNN